MRRGVWLHLQRICSQTEPALVPIVPAGWARPAMAALLQMQRICSKRGGEAGGNPRLSAAVATGGAANPPLIPGVFRPLFPVTL
jgi:hypothetical protein